MKKLLSIMMLAAVLAAPGGGVQAQSLSRILARTGLTPDDYTMMSAAARGLYDTPSPRPGKTVSWSNPESGSHGTVKLAAICENCAYLQHFAYAKTATTSREIRIRMCEDASGKWLMHP